MWYAHMYSAIAFFVLESGFLELFTTPSIIIPSLSLFIQIICYQGIVFEELNFFFYRELPYMKTNWWWKRSIWRLWEMGYPYHARYCIVSFQFTDDFHLLHWAHNFRRESLIRGESLGKRLHGGRNWQKEVYYSSELTRCWKCSLSISYICWSVLARLENSMVHSYLWLVFPYQYVWIRRF